MNRGNKLWEGHRIILPAFRTRVVPEEEELPPRPDREALRVIEERIKTAAATGKIVRVTFSSSGRRCEKTGRIVMVLSAARVIKLQTPGRKLNVPLDSILSVEPEEK